MLPMLEVEAKERQGTRTDITEQIPECDEARNKAASLTKTNAHYISDVKKLAVAASRYCKSAGRSRSRVRRRIGLTLEVSAGLPILPISMTRPWGSVDTPPQSPPVSSRPATGRTSGPRDGRGSCWRLSLPAEEEIENQVTPSYLI